MSGPRGDVRYCHKRTIQPRPRLSAIGPKRTLVFVHIRPRLCTISRSPPGRKVLVLASTRYNLACYACAVGRCTGRPDDAAAAAGQMGDHMQRTIALCLLAGVVIAATPGYAQKPDNTVTCTGILIDVAMRPKVWSLAVIYDAAGGYTCMVDRSNSRHDPMRPCSMGDMCHLVGTYSRKIDTTYVIDRISTIDKVEE